MPTERILEEWRTCENCYFRQLKSFRGERLHHVCINEYSWHYKKDRLWKSEIAACECHLTWEEVDQIDGLQLIKCDDCKKHWQWSAGCGWFCNIKLSSHGGKPGLCLGFPLHTLIDKIPTKEVK